MGQVLRNSLSMCGVLLSRCVYRYVTLIEFAILSPAQCPSVSVESPATADNETFRFGDSRSLPPSSARCCSTKDNFSVSFPTNHHRDTHTVSAREALGTSEAYLIDQKRKANILATPPFAFHRVCVRASDSNANPRGNGSSPLSSKFFDHLTQSVVSPSQIQLYRVFDGQWANR